MIVQDEQLKLLFEAFTDQNEDAFRRIAKSIIDSQNAANHHVAASKLKRSLAVDSAGRSSQQTPNFSFLPRDRRNGEELVRIEESRVDFTKIVLAEKTKAKVERVLQEHRMRNTLEKFGFQPKNKLLFWGPPGCGKTMTASYIACELGLPIGILRLNAVISSFLGDTASHLHRVFELANTRPMVLLLDEVDAIGKNRDDRNDVGELKRVVNSLLQAFDFFTSSRSIVIAATNHQYLLDAALWRRFDDIVSFPIPTLPEKSEYVRNLLNGVRHEDLKSLLGRKTRSFSFGDLERIINESLKSMILDNRKELKREDVELQIQVFHEGLPKSPKESKTRGT